MRKHDEGYALVLVLVVMVVLSIAATSLMSVGLRNLKGQQAVGERMVDKYAAQGEIEKIIAVLSEETSIKKDTSKKAEKQVEEWIKAIPEITSLSGSWTDLEVTAKTETTDILVKGSFSANLSVKAEYETAIIQCELSISGTYEEAESETIGEGNIYKIKFNEPTYQTYVISHTAATEPAEGGGEG